MFGAMVSSGICSMIFRSTDALIMRYGVFTSCIPGPKNRLIVQREKALMNFRLTSWVRWVRMPNIASKVCLCSRSMGNASGFI